MSQDLNHYIPGSLDDAGKFLFWDLDVAAIAVCGVLIGLAAEMPVIGVIVGLAGGYFYNKVKAGQHPGMANHLFYWFTGVPTPKELPGSHVRELNG